MSNYRRNMIAAGTIFSLFIISMFIALQEFNTDLLHRIVKEDGLVENLTAILFGLSSISFIVFASRSVFLSERSRWSYLMTISWALLMFIFMGEEISWGQRILGITTPDQLREINLQGELNIHNISFVDSFMGGKYRYLSIMMITTGLLLPLLALSEWGKRIIQRVAFPVSPMCFAPLFVGAYLFGYHYYPIIANDAAEVRECIMSIGMFCFALTGAVAPGTLFRISPACSDNLKS